MEEFINLVSSLWKHCDEASRESISIQLITNFKEVKLLGCYILCSESLVEVDFLEKKVEGGSV
jgi:hypothetical protein